MAFQNKRSKGPQPVLSIQTRPASQTEAKRLERALDRLLAELVRQERAHGRKHHGESIQRGR